MITSRTPASFLVIVFGALAIISFASHARAVTIFTDRAEWEAATNIYLIEDFESETNLGGNDDFSIPHTTTAGIRIGAMGGGSSPQWLASGLVNGSQEPHIRAFNTRISWNPPGSFSTFGFDYDTASESWDILLNSSTVATLSSFRNGFIGFSGIGSPESFEIRSTSQVQGGISIDNLAFGIPEPGSLSLMATSLAILLLRRKRR